MGSSNQDEEEENERRSDSDHILHCFAASKVLRIHSETVCFLALALAPYPFNSDGVTRIRRVSFLATPLGSAGRPGFFGFGLFSGSANLLNNSGLNCDLLVGIEYVVMSFLYVITVPP